MPAKVENNDRIVSPAATALTSPRTEEATTLEAPVPMRPAAAEAPADAFRSVPLREIALKVHGDANSGVDVRILDNKGKVHVEVRTADNHLATSLQENIGDLVGSLDKSGYRTELGGHDSTTTVSATGSSQQLTSDNGRHPASDQGSMAGQGGHSGQQHQQGQGRGNRPRWLEEIVRNFDPAVQEKENQD